MKIQPRALPGFLKNPPPEIVAVLLYGPDQGAVADYAVGLVGRVAEDPKDPFRVADLSAKEAMDQNGRLLDEMQAMALTGGRRAIRVRSAADSITGEVKSVAETVAPGGNLLVIEAGDLSPRSSLRSLAEKSDSVAAIACYLGDAESTGALARQEVQAAGLTLDPEAERLLGERLSGDRRMARQEIEKLIVYAWKAKRIDADLVLEVVGDSAAESTDQLLDAVATGNVPEADRMLMKLLGEDQSPVGIVRAAQRHFEQLRQAGERRSAGEDQGKVLASLRIFFKRKGAFSTAMQAWPPAAARQALSQLLDAEAQLKRSGPPDVSVINRSLLQLAFQAKTKLRRRR